MKKVLFLMNLREASGEYSPAIFNWYGILERLGYEVYYEDYAQYDADAFYNLVKETKPDFIFHPTYVKFHSEFARLREFSKVYCIHSDDDWRFDDYTKYWIPFTDGAIGYQSNIKNYLQAGAKEDYYQRARWAFNPNTMLFDFSGKKEHKISHVGGLHGNKAQRVNDMKQKGFDVTCINPNFNSYSQYLQSFSRSIVSLSLTSNSLGTGAQSKTRLSEIPYYCVLASEPWPDMELWNLEPNKDFILLDESDKSFEMLERVLEDKDFADKMYQSGKRVLIEHNTVFHEWNKFMQHLDPDYKPVDVASILKTYNL